MSNQISAQEPSIESIHSLRYNYGNILNSQCSDLSNSNRLAISTEKCIFILNLNQNFPNEQSGCMPSKFLYNFQKLSTKKTKSSIPPSNQPKSSLPLDISKQSFQIQAWVDDLNENKNHFISIDSISSLPKSKLVENIYKDFYSLDDASNVKRKSFLRSVREVVSNKKKKTEDIKPDLSTLDTNIVQNNLIQIIDANFDQFSKHKQLTDQMKFYDADFYEYLSFLNTVNNPSSTQTPIYAHINSGFKYCKWNQNLKVHLLCVISNCNQFYLIDCTSLKHQSQVTDTAQLDSGIFDSKTESKFFNLTEIYLNKTNPEFLNTKPKNLDDFYHRIVEITPLSATWSKILRVNDHLSELLFISFKSNKIGIFSVVKDPDEENLKIDLIANLDLNLKDEIKENFFSSFDKRVRINCSSFYHQTELNFGILSIGLTNGQILLTKILLENINEKNINSTYKVTKSLSNLGPVEKIELFKIDLLKFLLVVQRENSMIFILVSYSKESGSFYEEDFEPLIYYQNDNESFNSYKSINNTYNDLIKNHIKLIDFKLINSKSDSNYSRFEFMVNFQNTFIKNLIIELRNFNCVEKKVFEIVQNFLLNDTSEIKFDVETRDKSNDSSTETNLSLSDYFKITQNIFLSSNKYLIYQVNSFKKLDLVQKKPLQLEVNIYRVRSCDKLIELILPSSNYPQYTTPFTNIIDIIWLFKRQLYLNKDFFNEKLFKYLYEFLKNKEKYKNDLILLKRMRNLSFTLSKYFQLEASFEVFNHFDKPEGNAEEDEESEDEESEVADEISRDTNEFEEEAKVNDKTKVENSIIKSSSYYSTIFRELSLTIFKNHSLIILLHAEKIGFNNLSNHEKMVLLLMGEFAIKKNLLIERKELENWLKENFLNKSTDNKLTINKTLAFVELLSGLKCDLCGEIMEIEQSNELNSIKCRNHHEMMRCQKSLLPLNNFKFKSCSLCNSAWNYFNKNDFPNFLKLFSDQNFCLFCN